MFCKHKWQLVSEKLIESQAESIIDKVAKTGGELSNGKGFKTDRTFIQIVACEKCGKLKRFVEIV